MKLLAAYRPAIDTATIATRRTFEGDDYAQLVAEARAAAPEGQVLLHIQRDNA